MSNNKNINNNPIDKQKTQNSNVRTKRDVRVRESKKSNNLQTPTETKQSNNPHDSETSQVSKETITKTESSTTHHKTENNSTPVSENAENSKKSENKDTKTPSRSVLKERQLSTRTHRRERHAKRKRELLESAIGKLKAHNNGDDDALKNLEKSISNHFSGDTPQSHIETSVSEKEILANAEATKTTQLTPLKTQNAKDRFKNAIKGIVAAKTEVKETEEVKPQDEDPKTLMMKKKIEERKRIKKMVSGYLEEMGLTYQNNNFQFLSNQLTDILLLNIDTTLPKYKNKVAQLKKREELPIRSGQNTLVMKQKKSNAETVVGNLFSHYPINKDKQKTSVNDYITLKQLKIPNDNFDEIREGLLKYLLFDNKNLAMYEGKPFDFDDIENIQHQSENRMSSDQPISLEKKSVTPQQHVELQPRRKMMTKESLLALARQKSMTLEKNTQGNFVIKPKEIPLNTKLRDLIQKPFSHAADNVHHVNELKSKLQKLISRNHV